MAITDINQRTSSIIDALKDITEIGESGVEIIKNCLASIHSITPLEGAVLFSRLESINASLDDLSYLMFMLDSKRSKLINEYNSKRDPLYVALVRQDRPSDKAISSEIRLQNKEICNLEESIEALNNVKSYLSHIERGMIEYSRILRDKINYTK